jgi:hypothetical protein
MKRLLFLAALVGFLSSSCSFQKSAATGWDYSADPTTAANTDKLNNYEVNGRMVIMDADLQMEVSNIDSTVDELMAIAFEYDGYVVSSSNFKTMIRLDSKEFTTAMNRIKKLGEVTAQTITGKDVTEEFFDLELRLENAKNARIRYTELLHAAKNVDEILRIEHELERLNGTIDSIAGKLEKLSHLDRFATLTIHHRALLSDDEPKLGVLSYVGLGIYKGVRWLFVRN